MKKSQQTNTGQFRKKREDTLIKSIEKKYDVDFNVRDDMKLGTYLKNKGLPSLSKAIDRITKKK
ncbi:hypothetical protein GW901_00465 [Candidatus Parcubacteria bacterium]|nr:hypothetical protein [Candidatus Parcubacteria bacterium]